MSNKHLGREPIAVVGMGLRFPGGLNAPAELWDALLAGRDAIGEVPKDRFDIDRFHDSDLAKSGRVRSRRGGFVEGVDQFDAEFFGYFPGEAARIDPQQRFALEAAYDALEDGGAPLERMAGTRTSVFLGSFMYDHLCMQTSPLARERINAHGAMGVSNTSIANRISHRFDLRGPSVTLDTACSASLVAIHLACRSIWSGEADAALAGGVNLILRPESTILLSKAGFLSPDGACKAFDASANGYVRSEGAGVVFLKPLSRALADGDRVYAVVRGSAVNQDGYTPEGFTVPSESAQAAMLADAYADAGVDPAQVAYVEAHGPGTIVGDPIETRALGTVLGRGRAATSPLWIGSIKTNLGHLEGASGVAGFIKAALCAYHRRAPRNLHFKNPNPAIDFAGLKLAVPAATVELAAPDAPVFVGVNSFGAGGTNAHLVLAAPPSVVVPPAPTTEGVRPFVLSARSPAALAASAKNLAAHVRHKKPAAAALAHTLERRRSRHAHGAVVVARNVDELAARLDAFASGAAAPEGALAFRRSERRPAKTAFVFSGQGGQWIDMGRELAADEPVFAAALAAFDERFERLAGFSIRAEIAKPAGASRLDDTVVVQPAIAGIQIALARLLEAKGFRVDGCVGHSIGEVAAAHLAGALTLDQAVGVIRGRSVVQDRASGAGRMLAVGLSVEEAERLIAPLRGTVEIATINGPQALALAGDSAPLERIAKTLEGRGVFARFVNVQVPYHSRFMDPLEVDLVATLAPYAGAAASVPLYSTVTTGRESGAHLDGRYWFENVRRPVRFVETVQRMLADGYDLFVEIGPHPVLTTGVRDVAAAAGADALVAPAMTKKQPARDTAALALGLFRATSAAAAVADEAPYAPVDLPRYPFQRARHWFETPEAERSRLGAYAHPFVKARRDLSDDGRACFEASLDVAQTPALGDHRVDGAVVFPATGHIELAHAAASLLAPHSETFLEDLRFEQPVVLAEGEAPPPEVRLETTTAEGDYVVLTRPAGSPDGAAWTRCSQGRINGFGDRTAGAVPAHAEVAARVGRGVAMDVDRFYADIRRAGLDYGPAFRCVRELRHRAGEIFATLELPSHLAEEARRFDLHPALLDACIHLVFADVHLRGDPSYVYLPYRIAHVRRHRKWTGGPVTAYVRVVGHDETFLKSDTYVYGADGEPIVEVVGMTCKRIAGAHAAGDEGAAYETRFEREAAAVEAAPPDAGVLRWAMLADGEPPLALAAAAAAAFPEAQGVVYADVDEAWSLRAEPEPAGRPRGYEVRARAGRSPAEALAGLTLDRRTHVLLVADRADVDESSTAADVSAAVGGAAASLFALAKELARTEATPNVAVILRRGLCVEGRAFVSPAAAALEAAARVVANELPNVRVRIVDLDDFDAPESVEALREELSSTRAGGFDTAVAFRGGVRHVRRVVRVDLAAAERARAVDEPASGGAYRFAPDGAGTLDGVVARRVAVRAPGAHEVAVAVRAAGLNFKDVMNGMSLLSERAVEGGLAGRRLGLEVAGVVEAVGAEVTDLRVGDRVMARVADGFAGRAVASRDLVARMPTGLSFAEAACVPVVYVTAHYGLSHLARLERGESVLIHSGAGGVGVAAIRLAVRLGARVFATAGSPERRAWLKTLGVEGAFDSRSLSFYDDVMEATGGRGVDVVLNSLTGRLLFQSVKCLAPFGRFVEIGKTDIYRNARLGLERLGDNVSFFAVDVDRLAAQKPAAHRRVLDEVAAMFERGELPPHPVETLPVGELGAALKRLSRANVTGKIAVEMGEGVVSTLPEKRLELRGDRTYLVTGGAGGFGLELARLLAARGARHLALVSRSGPKRDEDAETIAALRAQGVDVRLEKADVADPAAVEALFDRLAALPPLAGVVHSAAVLDDARAADTSPERFAGVFAPKALGAWNLHRATLARGAELDFFVMLSSISAVLGLFGQPAYAAANQFLDALAARRRAAGLPGLALNLGVLGDYAGMSRRSDATNGVLETLETVGLLPMTLPAALSGFETAVLHGATQRLTAATDWSRFFKAYPHLQRDGAFAALARAKSSSGGGGRGAGLRDRVLALPAAERAPALAGRIGEGLAKVLGVEPGKIALDEPLDRLALDSLTLTQLRNFVLREWETSVPLIRLMKGPSLLVLAAELLGDGPERGAATAKTADAAASTGVPQASALVRGAVELNKWLIRGASTGDEPVRLICFHSMGVGASLFGSFLADPPAGFDVLAVQTPGRETRADEEPLDRVDDVVRGALAALEPYLDRPFVVWGHSFGGIAAYEFVRALRRAGLRAPEHFVATGTIAPHLARIWQRRDVLLRVTVEDNSPEYLLALSRYVEDAEFVKSILPAMRRDAPLLLGYRFAEEAPLDVPVTTFAARQDDMVYPDEIKPWSRHTSGRFELIEVDGDHWFLHRNRGLLRATLESVRAAAQAEAAVG